jgi:hypothetical protein
VTRTLSWDGTFWMTRFFPVVWITGFGVGALWLLVSPSTIAWNGVRGGAPPGAGWLLLCAWVVGSALILLLAWGLKRVRLRDDNLLVSNYLREVSIPLTDVASVRQRVFPHAGSITIEFRSETPFGRRVTFIPSGRLPRWYGDESVILQELRALVARTDGTRPRSDGASVA